MAVGFHGERAAVFMPEPAGDGWDLDSGFDSDGGKQMPKVLVGDARNTEFACRAGNCSFCASFTRKTFSLGDSALRSLCICPNSVRASGIIGTRRTVQFFVPVSGSPRPTISPAAKSRSRQRISAASPLRQPVNARPPQKIGAIARAPRTGSLDCFDELEELGAARQRELLRTHRHALQLGRWIAVNDARFNCHVEPMPETSNRVVVAR